MMPTNHDTKTFPNFQLWRGLRGSLVGASFVACFAVVAAATELPLGLAQRGLQGSIEVERRSYDFHDPIRITLVITNVSEAPIAIDPWPGNWFVQVFDEKVKIIEPTFRAMDVMRPMVQPLTLKPGERWQTVIQGLHLVTGLPGSTPDWEYSPLQPGSYWLGAEYTALADARYPKMWLGGLNCKFVEIKVSSDWNF